MKWVKILLRGSQLKSIFKLLCVDFNFFVDIYHLKKKTLLSSLMSNFLFHVVNRIQPSSAALVE